MVCRMCMKQFGDLLYIFNEKDNELKMAKVIGKHFWFEPKKDDRISIAICKYCWDKISDFDEYYKMIEAAHAAFQHCLTTQTDKITNSSFCINEPECIFYFPYKSDEGKGSSKTEEISIMQSKETKELEVNTIEIISPGVSSDNSICDAFSRKTDSPCHKLDETCEQECERSIESDILAKSIRRKIIRRKTISKIKNNVLKKKNHLVKPKKDIKELEDYKSKIKEYDAEIAEFMTLYCDICNSKSENFPALRVHMRSVHNITEGYVTCCQKKFNKRALLLYHIRQHLNPNCYRCEECDFTFSDRQSRHNHFLVKHQKDEDKKYACSQCSNKFVRKYLLEQHKSFSHREFIPKCKNCGKRFKSVKELTDHNKEDCYPGTMCDICAKCIRGAAAFKRHQLEHRGVCLPKVQCNLCGFWYKDQRSLKRHHKKHTEAKQQHICDICQKISPSRSAMLSHKRYAHGTDRIHECNICQKTFKKPISLKEHMTTHTGEVLYCCPLCPKTFNSNANMHSHRKKMHPKEFEEARKQRRQQFNS